MAVVITVADVRDMCNTSASDATIQLLIDFVSQADACLDANGVPDDTQRLLKLYAVCHMLTMQDGGGIRSESDMDGESVTFARAFDQHGLGGSQYGALIQVMPGYSCIAALIDNPRRSSAILNYSH